MTTFWRGPLNSHLKNVKVFLRQPRDCRKKFKGYRFLNIIHEVAEENDSGINFLSDLINLFLHINVQSRTTSRGSQNNFKVFNFS